MNIGTTFDPQHAKYLGLNWKDTLKQILDLGIDPIRIGIKWNHVEKESETYEWDEYDELFSILEENGARIIATVGMKAPRWPEFVLIRVPASLSRSHSRTNLIEGVGLREVQMLCKMSIATDLGASSSSYYRSQHRHTKAHRKPRRSQ